MLAIMKKTTEAKNETNKNEIPNTVEIITNKIAIKENIALI